MNDGHQKVTARHLARCAYLYVRQSTMRQVLENTESTKRQYALRDRATALGWSSDSVVVIDCDLGQSAASAADRAGFQKLVAEVGMGNAGIVLGLEVSRLARNSTDWHRLLEICALTDTLILDEDGLYDPAHFNDRLLLGLKGTMSEAELHILRARLRGGIINKARRGELRRILPVGFLYDGQGRVVLDPDEQVQQSVRLLFDTFRQKGAAHGTIKHFHKQGLEFPKRLLAAPQKGQLVWGPLSLGRLASILHNPWYAGVYAYGRTRWGKRPGAERTHERLPPSEWIALIRDAHPAYITWEQYQQNQQQLERSSKALHFRQGRPAPREGTALLQGRAVCGLCGCHMHVLYDVRQGQPIPKYACRGQGALRGNPHCQSLVGTELDAAVSALVVESVTPMALEMTLAVQEELRRRSDEADSLRRKTVERARYEVELARQRYMHVDPANRLVAASLEAEWNAKMREHDAIKNEYERQRSEDRFVVDAAERERILALATDFPAVWRNPNTPNRERKRMLALLVEDVTIVKQQQIVATVRFRGGATTTLTVSRRLTSRELYSTPDDVRRQLDELLDAHTDAEVARILNERGLRTGIGAAFDAASVRWVRYSAKLRSHKQRLLDAGMLRAAQLAKQLGVDRSTLGTWRNKGLVDARIATDNGEWLYWPPKSIPPHRRSSAKRRANSPNPSPTAKGAVCE